MFFAVEKISLVILGAVIGIYVAFALGPAGYGEYQKYILIVNVTYLAISLGILQAVVKQTVSRDDHHCLQLPRALLMTFVSAFIGGGILQVFGFGFGGAMALAVAMLCTNAVEVMLARSQNLILISKLKIASSLFYAAVKVFSVQYAPKAETFILIFILETATQFAISVSIIGTMMGKGKLKYETQPVAAYIRQNKFLFFSSITGNLSLRMMIYPAGLLFDNYLFGLIAFVNRLCEIGFSLCTHISIYFSFTLERDKEGVIFNFLERIRRYRRAFLWLVVCGSAALFLAQDWYVWVLGDYGPVLPVLLCLPLFFLYWVSISITERYDVITGRGLYTLNRQIASLLVFVSTGILGVVLFGVSMQAYLYAYLGSNIASSLVVSFLGRNRMPAVCFHKRLVWNAVR